MVPTGLIYWMLQVKFDNTITLGNLLSAITFLLLAGMAWADLRWRVANLETWRKEHMVDADSRDRLITKMDKVLDRLSWVEEERNRLPRRQH